LQFRRAVLKLAMSFNTRSPGKQFGNLIKEPSHGASTFLI